MVAILFLLNVRIQLVSTRINRCVRMISYAFLDVHSDICQAQLHVLPSRVQFIHRTLKEDNYTSTATYVYQILFQTIGWILIKYTCVGIECPIYMQLCDIILCRPTSIYNKNTSRTEQIFELIDIGPYVCRARMPNLVVSHYLTYISI